MSEAIIKNDEKPQNATEEFEEIPKESHWRKRMPYIRTSAWILFGSLLSVAILVLVAFSPMVYGNGSGIVWQKDDENYYLWELLQMEDYIDSSAFNLNGGAVHDFQEQVELVTDAAWDSYVTMEYDSWGGEFYFLFSGTGTVDIQGDVADQDKDDLERINNFLKLSIDVVFPQPANLNLDAASIRKGYEHNAYKEVEDDNSDVDLIYTKRWYVYGKYELPATARVGGVPQCHQVQATLQLNNDLWAWMEGQCQYAITIMGMKIQTDEAFIWRKDLADDMYNIVQDIDGDGINNDNEVLQGTCPYKVDVDRDGVADPDELIEGTDPLYRDTDHDGLRDGVELCYTPAMLVSAQSRGSYFERIGSDPFPPAPQPGVNTQIDNLHSIFLQNPAAARPAIIPTSAIHADSDLDGLPDGCTDGWGYNTERREWGRFEDQNGLHDVWEGEDLNLDTVFDNVANPGANAIFAETDYTKADSDTDKMDDGWERWFSINPLDSTNEDGPDGNIDGILGITEYDQNGNPFIARYEDYSNPQVYMDNIANWDDAQAIYQDDLDNLEEYVMGTNPRVADTDGDSIRDHFECDEIIFRTSVEEGALTAAHYGNNGDWIWFKGSDCNLCKKWIYQTTSVETITIQNEPLFGTQICDPLDNKITYIHSFDESSWIYLDRDQISVCSVDQLDNGQYQMIRHKFIVDQGNTAVVGSLSIDDDFPLRQISNTNPLRIHTDGVHYLHKVVFEGPYFTAMPDGGANGVIEVDFDGDDDGDGVDNPRDIDSDNDGIQDPFENIDFTDPTTRYEDWDSDGKVNIEDPDGDGDGIDDWYEIQRGTEKRREFTDNIMRQDYAYRYDYPTFLSPFNTDSDMDGANDGLFAELYTQNTIKADNYDTIEYYLSLGYDYYTLNLNDNCDDNDGGGIQYMFIGETTHNGYYALADNPDSDGDGLWDYDSVTQSDVDGRSYVGEKVTNSNPFNKDTDGDTLEDGFEYFGWTIRYTLIGGTTVIKKVSSKPTTKNSDSDGIKDQDEYRWGYNPGNPDTDGDGLDDNKEDYYNGGPNGVFDKDVNLKPLETDPLNGDTDGDHLPDGWIDYNKNNVLDLGEYEDGDLDKNLDTPIKETDPKTPDTDGDGVIDWIEHSVVVFRTTDLYFDNKVNYILVDIGERQPALFVYDQTQTPKVGVKLWRDTNNNPPDGSFTTISSEFQTELTNAKSLGTTPKYHGSDAPQTTDYYIKYHSDVSADEYALYIVKSTDVALRFDRVDWDVKDVPSDFQHWYPVHDYMKGTTTVRISNANTANSDGVTTDTITDSYMIYDASRFDEVYLMLMNADGDTVYNAFEVDADNDGYDNKDDIYMPWPTINDGEQWKPLEDLDADLWPNILDHDSDGDGIDDQDDDDTSDGDGDGDWYNPYYYDQDNDGISDGDEDTYGTSKFISDCDGDGILDGKEKDWNFDTDKDGFINALDVDSDGDGLMDGKDIKLTVYRWGIWTTSPVTRSYQITVGSGSMITSDPVGNDVNSDDIARDYDVWTYITGEHTDATQNTEGIIGALEFMLEDEWARNPYSVLEKIVFGHATGDIDPDTMNLLNLVFTTEVNKWEYKIDPTSSTKTDVDLVDLDTVDPDSLTGAQKNDYRNKYKAYYEFMEGVQVNGADKWHRRLFTYTVVFQGEDTNANGLLDTGETSPVNVDTDGDNVLDGGDILFYTNGADRLNPLLGTIEHRRVWFENWKTNHNNGYDWDWAYLFIGEDMDGDGQHACQSGSMTDSNPRSTDSDGDEQTDFEEVHSFIRYDRIWGQDDYMTYNTWSGFKKDMGEIPYETDGTSKYIEVRTIILERGDYELSFAAYPGAHSFQNPKRTVKVNIDWMSRDGATTVSFDRIIDDHNTDDVRFTTYTKTIWRWTPYVSEAQDRKDWLAEQEAGYYISEGLLPNLAGTLMEVYSYRFNLKLEDIRPGTYRIRIENVKSTGDDDDTLVVYGIVVNKMGLNPATTDSDQDGLNDNAELLGLESLQTSPFLADSDWDYFSDSDELALGLDPSYRDTDEDGIVDSQDMEYFNLVDLQWSDTVPRGYLHIDDLMFSLVHAEGNTDPASDGTITTYTSDMSERNLLTQIKLYLHSEPEDWSDPDQVADHFFRRNLIATEISPHPDQNGVKTYKIGDQYTYPGTELKYTKYYSNYDVVIKNDLPYYDEQGFHHTQFQCEMFPGEYNRYILQVSIHESIDNTATWADMDGNHQLGLALYYQVYSNYVVYPDTLSFMPQKWIAADWVGAEPVSTPLDNPKNPYNVYQFVIDIPEHLANNDHTLQPEEIHPWLNPRGYLGFDLMPLWVDRVWEEGHFDDMELEFTVPDFNTINWGSWTVTQLDYGCTLFTHEDYPDLSDAENFASDVETAVANQLLAGETGPNTDWSRLPTGKLSAPTVGSGVKMYVINTLNEPNALTTAKDAFKPSGGNLALHHDDVYAVVYIAETDTTSMDGLADFVDDFTWSKEWSQVFDTDDASVPDIEFRKTLDKDRINQGDLPGTTEIDDVRYLDPTIIEVTTYFCWAYADSWAAYDAWIGNLDGLLPRNLIIHDVPRGGNMGPGVGPQSTGQVVFNTPNGVSRPTTGTTSADSMQVVSPGAGVDDLIDGALDTSNVKKDMLEAGWLRGGKKALRTITDKFTRAEVPDELAYGDGSSPTKRSAVKQGLSKIRAGTTKILGDQTIKHLKSLRGPIGLFGAGAAFVGGVFSIHGAIIAVSEGDIVLGLYLTANAANSFAWTCIGIYQFYMGMTHGIMKTIAIVEICAGMIDMVVGVYLMANATNDLEKAVAEEYFALATARTVMACFYFIPILGQILLALNWLCLFITSILAWIGWLPKSMDLVEVFYRIALWLQGKKAQMDILDAMNEVNDQLLKYTNKHAKNEQDPKRIWMGIWLVPY